MKRAFAALALALSLVMGAAAPALAQRQGPIAGGATAEQRFRRGLGRIVKARLQLTDAQMQRLQSTNQKYEKQRLTLLEQERDARMGLRAELVADSANQPRVASLIDQWLKVQRQRLELVDAEQHDLAQFMSPVQRAKYVVLQEELRRRAEEMRRNRQEQRRSNRAGAPPRPD